MTAPFLNYKPNSKPHRAVKKRLDNLQDVIYYESIAQTNDSVLNLAAMTKDEQEQYFNQLIQKLKAEQEKKIGTTAKICQLNAWVFN